MELESFCILSVSLQEKGKWVAELCVCVCSSLPGDESASVGTVSPSAAGGALDL